MQIIAFDSVYNEDDPVKNPPLPTIDYVNLHNLLVGVIDREGKGHITAQDLRRVCLEMGYKVSQRDAENMIAVMAPTQRPLGPGEGIRAEDDEAAATDAAESADEIVAALDGYKKLTGRVSGILIAYANVESRRKKPP